MSLSHVDKVVTLGDKYGYRRIAAIFALVIGGALTLAGIALVGWSANSIGFGLLAPGLLFDLLAIGYMLRSPEFSTGSSEVQAIIWRGWERENRYEKPHRVELLLYERGFDILPPIRSRRSDFDVLLLDMSFLNANCTHGIVQPIKDEHAERIFDKLWLRLRDMVRPSCHDRKGYLGIPVEFGFSEILVVPAAFGGTLGQGLQSELKSITEYRSGRQIVPIATPPISYDSFNLVNLCAEKADLRIGIWNWFLPALLHLLLVHRKALNRPPGREITVENVHNCTVEEVQSVLNIVRSVRSNNGAEIRIIDSLGDLTDSIRHRRHDLILGSGTSAFPINFNYNSDQLIPVVPREDGVVVWFNTAAVLNTRDLVPAEKLITHWLSDEIQRDIPQNPSYRALPVSEAILKEVLDHGGHPSDTTLALLWGKGGQKMPVGYRLLCNLDGRTNDYRLWQYYWEEFVDELSP